MKEYTVENGTTPLEPVSLSQLSAELMSRETYEAAHQGLVILCHDVLIEYENGILLIKRKNFPAKDILWPIGGRVKRGMLTENSLREKVFQECHLELSEIRLLSHARTFFHTAPFGHGRGTDTYNLMYYAKGSGMLKLDAWHEAPTLVSAEQYTAAFRAGLHPYVQDFMDMVYVPEQA